MRYLILVLLLSGCTGRFYAGVGVGKNGVMDYNNWEGRESTACTAEAGYAWRRPDYDIDLGWAHYSQCTRGDMFDDREEDTLDSVTINGRYYF